MFKINYMNKRFILIPLIFIFMLSVAACTQTVRETPKEEDGMVSISQGKFKMGLDDGEQNEKPQHDIFLGEFKIDKYEVSAKEFAEFLNDRGNLQNQYFSHDNYSTVMGISKIQGKEVETRENPQSYIPRKGFDNFPANNVSWFGAYSYCQWKGKRLPTEAEWEKAARGKDGRIYPWGNSIPDDSKARYSQKWEEKEVNVMVPVDALPQGASYYNVFNMAGNVWEWVNDWYRLNYCKPCSHTPADASSEGTFKILRGGSWYDSYGDLAIRSTYRYWLDPADRYLNTGFRCVK